MAQNNKIVVIANYTPLQKILYPFIRWFFYFFFTYLPYGPVKRLNKPKNISGPILYCSSHGNFMCDVTLAGWELERAPRFLAKATLFKFPIKGFLEFCGTLPLIRPQDREKVGGSAAEQNKQSFSAASAALQAGWPICILPEGTSAEAPGIVLPLKSGVARLAFAAESEYNWQIGLRIFPVGLEYHQKLRTNSGMNVRYGRELLVADYAELYRQDEEAAVKKLMDDITKEMTSNFPHFSSDEDLLVAETMVELGIFANSVAASRAFARWSNEQKNKRVTLTQELLAQFDKFSIPYEGFRSLEKIQAWPILIQITAYLFVLLAWPLAIWGAIHSALNRLLCRTLAWRMGNDKTEFMTFRMGLGVVLSLPLFWLQWRLLAFTPFAFASYWAYTALCLFSWWVEKHWINFWQLLGAATKARRYLRDTLMTDYMRIRTEISGA